MRVRLFSLSLTGTTFSLFSSLAPNSVRSWNELEQKYHDYFYNGDNETKLTDLTSIRQGRDESIQEYFKKFKDIKNPCFNLSLSEKDLVDLALAGLRSSCREKLDGSSFYSINQTMFLFKKLNLKKKKIPTSPIIQTLTLLNMIPIHRTMRTRRYMLPSLFGPLRPNHLLVHLLSRLKRIGKKI